MLAFHVNHHCDKYNSILQSAKDDDQRTLEGDYNPRVIVTVRALTDIKAGGEILINYGKSYFEAKELSCWCCHSSFKGKSRSQTAIGRYRQE
jgi:SET domain-containing protein